MQNRRDWLKSTLSIAAGLPVGIALSDQLMAAPVSEIERQHLGKLHAGGVKIKLNSNENPYGPSEKAKRALEGIIAEGNRYAFDVQEEMKSILAQKEGVTPQHVALGAGSGDLLCQAGAAFGIEGGRIVSAFPTFPLLMNYATTFRATWDKVNLNDKLEHDYDAMAERVTDDT
ncbi:MAG TPA: aminotransferase class I/II-fold pyridoxal phosphate-dependent enzyme, partial [Chryseolinea sp.]